MQFPWKAYENRGWKKFKSYCVGFLSIKFLMSYALIATASWTNYTLPTTSWYTTILIKISIISRSPACCRNGEIWLWIIPSSAGAMSLHQNYLTHMHTRTHAHAISSSNALSSHTHGPQILASERNSGHDQDLGISISTSSFSLLLLRGFLTRSLRNKLL